ncbi:PREDICTED: KIF1-binding protein homolog isoform X2 [Branchiostoma belcheri]|uniref:KIF-binding protein n=1 Tax=Branchiostoma belcheri TaxID=7741 RepID=A0A6P4YGR6_BRABE|nr:PREDICTED: KIF1-binding protein homolog isoform X1 [Branchiostoma belcheri]XP_019621114.1 PREDICTED: KIF1-binding protein homolog isoform X2 [Branchiostoma belcheri]
MAAVYLQEQGFEEYARARRLSEEESRQDPETEPYRSKYKARELLLGLSEALKGFLDESQAEENVELTLQLGEVFLHLGSNFSDTEEVPTGEKYFSRCADLLQGHKLDQRCVNTILTCLNQLGILWVSRSEPEKALEMLQEAEELYKIYMHNVGQPPLQLHELLSPDPFGSPKSRLAEFEKTHTLTLYYLAQTYPKLGDNEKSAAYCHLTLSRQLQSGNYQPLDWATNCATLSQYYITRDNFTQGRHCLASASCVMSQVPEPCDEVEDGENETGREKLERRRADIARCWLKYCLVMLQESRQALMDDIGEMDRTKQKDLAEGRAVASSNGSHNDDKQEKPEDPENPAGADGPARHHGDEKSLLRFESLELTLEDQVTDRKVTDFDQARGVFLVGQKYVNAAKQFYVLDGHVTDFVEITQDWSQLFRALSFFEQDFERRCKMHKRRVDMLQSLLSELNQQHYLLVCRQIMYEIAETFSEMLDLKVAIAETGDERPTIHAVKKINTLAQQSIGHYQMFLDSLRNADKEMPKTFNEDTVRPALVAHFCVGRLYSKFLTSDPQLKLQNMSKSLDHYQYLVDYCTSHPDITAAVQSELEICTEMSQLLPIQMEKIRLTLT